jgi:hypothetical protein
MLELVGCFSVADSLALPAALIEFLSLLVLIAG